MTNRLNQKEISYLYNYLVTFEKEIKDKAGLYNIEEKFLRNFLCKEDIFLTTMAKSSVVKARRHQYYIRFEQNKRNPISNTDVAHHLMRHIRNSIAHGNLFKSNKDVYIFTDTNGKNDTMEGKLPMEKFNKLLELLQNSKKQ